MSEGIIKFVSARQWARTVKEMEEATGTQPPDDFGVRLGFNAEVETLKAGTPKPEGRQLLIAISSETVDRDGDTIAVEGWELEQYRMNPVVLFGHSYFNNDAPVVGRSLTEFVHKKKLKSLMEFTPQGMVPLADMLYGLYSEGYMKAASVGFIPKEWKFPDDEARPFGVDFLKQELIEYSLVPVPANHDALVEQRGALCEARSKGIDTGPLYEWVEEVLDAWAENKTQNLWVPKSVLKALREAADPKQATSVDVPDDIESKGAIGYGTAHSGGTPAAPKDAEWDGGAEVAAAEVDDLKVMCTWVDSENAEQKGAYKLPHHKAGGDHAVVWRGVTAAMGALLGARGGVDIPDGDRRGVYSHLAKHYRDDFDEEPPDFSDAQEESVVLVQPGLSFQLTPEAYEALSLLQSAQDAQDAELRCMASQVTSSTDWIITTGGDSGNGSWPLTNDGSGTSFPFTLTVPAIVRAPQEPEPEPTPEPEPEPAPVVEPEPEPPAVEEEMVELSDETAGLLEELGYDLDNVESGEIDDSEGIAIVEEPGSEPGERSQSGVVEKLLGEIISEGVEAAITQARKGG